MSPEKDAELTQKSLQSAKTKHGTKAIPIDYSNHDNSANGYMMVHTGGAGDDEYRG